MSDPVERIAIRMLHREKELCREWATYKREITRVYFFGSRVWGTPRPDSDLDILVVAHPGAAMLCMKEWSDQLGDRLGLTVHLIDCFTADEGLKADIIANGLLVFSRYKSDDDFRFDDELGEIDPDAQ